MTPQELKELKERQDKMEAEKKKTSDQTEATKALQEQLSSVMLELAEAKKLNNNSEIQKQLAADEKKRSELISEADIKNLLKDDDSNNDLEDLTNKDVLNLVADAFDKALDARDKLSVEAINRPLEDLGKRIDDVQQFLLKKEAVSGINEAKNMFDDFDTYEKDVSQILTVYPNMTPTDAYLLAKSKKSFGSPPQKHVESEKPVNLATRAENAQTSYEEDIKKQEEDGRKIVLGSRGFKAALMEAAEKTLSARGVKIE